MLQQFDERNRDLLVNINGELVHRDRAGVSPFDSVVQGGDGVWEGLRLYDGRIFRLTEHLDRLRASARALAFAEIPSHDAIIDEIRRTLDANGMRDGVHIRLTLSRGVKITSGMDPRLNQSGPTLIVLAEFKAPVYDKAGLRLITSSIRRFPPDCLDPKIHHNNLLQSILAKIEANHAGADAALMLDKHGFIAECNGTHVFLVSGGTVVTSTTDACPEGITRQTVLDLCAAHEYPARGPQRLYGRSLPRRRDVLHRHDGRARRRYGPRRPEDRRRHVGPMTRRLSVLFAEETATSGYPIFRDTKA